MIGEFLDFLYKIIASAWSMLNSSSPWMIFSFVIVVFFGQLFPEC